MKRFIALLALAITVVCALPAVAYASDIPYFTMDEYKQTADTYASDIFGFDLSEYPYYVVQLYRYNGEVLANLLYSKKPIVFCTKYYTPMYGGTFWPSGVVDDGTKYVLEDASDAFSLLIGHDPEYPLEYSKLWVDRKNYFSAYYLGSTIDSVTVEYGEIYTSHDIVNLETGETSFLKAPLTKLAEIVELSTRLQNPMSQVISLLPLLISLAVSFLALRKCLTTLSKLLRQG